MVTTPDRRRRGHTLSLRCKSSFREIAPNAARIVRGWVLRRQDELMDNWQRGRRHEAFHDAQARPPVA